MVKFFKKIARIVSPIATLLGGKKSVPPQQEATPFKPAVPTDPAAPGNPGWLGRGWLERGRNVPKIGRQVQATDAAPPPPGIVGTPQTIMQEEEERKRRLALAQQGAKTVLG